MEIIISKVAKQEFEDAQQFYELQQAGLGLRFKNEIKLALLRIQQFPEAWPLEREEIHKYLIHKFPYKILYGIQENKILILAFAHQHRDPFYWI